MDKARSAGHMKTVELYEHDLDVLARVQLARNEHGYLPVAAALEILDEVAVGSLLEHYADMAEALLESGRISVVQRDMCWDCIHRDGDCPFEGCWKGGRVTRCGAYEQDEPFFENKLKKAREQNEDRAV